MDPESFIALVGPLAVADQEKNGLPAAVTIAQAAAETGWLRKPILDSHTGEDSHNLFGLKPGSTWTGPTVEVFTHEYIRGQRKRVVAKFRAYPDYAASIADRAQILLTLERYMPALKVAHNPEAFAMALWACGWATNPSYAALLIDVMHGRRLVERFPPVER